MFSWAILFLTLNGLVAYGENSTSSSTVSESSTSTTVSESSTSTTASESSTSTTASESSTSTVSDTSTSSESSTSTVSESSTSTVSESSTSTASGGSTSTSNVTGATSGGSTSTGNVTGTTSGGSTSTGNVTGTASGGSISTSTGNVTGTTSDGSASTSTGNVTGATERVPLSGGSTSTGNVTGATGATSGPTTSTGNVTGAGHVPGSGDDTAPASGTPASGSDDTTATGSGVGSRDDTTATGSGVGSGDEWTTTGSVVQSGDDATTTGPGITKPGNFSSQIFREVQDAWKAMRAGWVVAPPTGNETAAPVVYKRVTLESTVGMKANLPTGITTPQKQAIADGLEEQVCSKKSMMEKAVTDSTGVGTAVTTCEGKEVTTRRSLFTKRRSLSTVAVDFEITVTVVLTVPESIAAEVRAELAKPNSKAVFEAQIKDEVTGALDEDGITSAMQNAQNKVDFTGLNLDAITVEDVTVTTVVSEVQDVEEGDVTGAAGTSSAFDTAKPMLATACMFIVATLV